MRKRNLSQVATLPEGFTMRPPTLDDAQGIADVFNAYLQTMVGRVSYSTEMFRGILTHPAIEIERDIRIILNDMGQVVAYSGVGNVAPYVEINLVFRIHPDYENPQIRSVLLNWGEDLAIESVERAPKDALVLATTWCFDKDTATLAYLADTDFEHVRSSYRMQIALNQPIPEQQFPSHIAIKTFAEVDHDLCQLIEADNEAFRDHWGYVSQPIETQLEQTQHWIDNSPNIDFNYWYLAMDGDEIAGSSLCAYYVIGQENHGHVDSLSVRPQWRRQGIALNLLYHSFHELKNLGRTHVTLSVDAQSLTGATRLYKKAGMEVIETTMTWEKILRGGKDYRTQELED